MTNKINLSDDKKYLLQRRIFEINNSIGNASFVLGHHLMDSNADFLNSDLWKRLMARAIECRINLNNASWQIASSLVGDKQSSMQYTFSQDCDEMEYRLNE